MGFTNYLTSYKAHLLKHVRGVFDFVDTSGLSEPVIKTFVDKLTKGTAIPIPAESFEWIASYFKYVEDKEQILSYNNRTGTWRYEVNDNKMRNMLTDYFTVIADEAAKNKSAVMYRYAQYFFTQGRIPNLVTRIKSAIIFNVGRAADVVRNTERYRYFETTEGKRALIDMEAPTFNMKEVSFKETQPLTLMHIAPVPISVTDALPTLFLSLIDEYMLHDKDRIAYFHKVLAYMMAPYNYNQVLLYFVGASGRNGKGTVVKVMQDILGPQTVRMNAELLSASPSPSFKKDDALAATEGRSLYIFNEIDERMQASTQNIKDLTEGGRDKFGNKIMTVLRPAYSRNYEVNICGTPIIIANNLINFSDWATLDPIFKRLVLVPFDYVIQKEDPEILNKLAEEYPKIQAWLYLNYFKNKDIRLKEEPKPADFEALFDQFRADSDIIKLFWDESIEEAPKEAILRADIYRMYVKYCQSNGRKPIRNKGSNGFSNIIKPLLKDYLTTTRQGLVYIEGIKRAESFDKENL